MASTPAKSPNASMATKDAMFLFDLFRESPTPILIQIGPYAAKTGAKPNTIIKRIAGIKGRNGLNISTTLGNYKPPATEAGKTKANVLPKTPKKEQHEAGSSLAQPSGKHEAKIVANGPYIGLGSEPWSPKALPTPVASPSSSSSAVSTQSVHDQSYMQPYQQPQLLPNTVMEIPSPLKRTFEVAELASEEVDLEGTPWKRVKAEG